MIEESDSSQGHSNKFVWNVTTDHVIYDANNIIYINIFSQAFVHAVKWHINKFLELCQKQSKDFLTFVSCI